jgi:hypothetical protein
MGLDMYAFSVESKSTNQNLMIDRENSDCFELAYWRKFNALHNWIYHYAKENYGYNEPEQEFNCVPVRLDMKAITQLRDDAINKRLVPVGGFFFGPQEIYDDDYDNIRDFCKKAVGEIFDGREVYYDSWW